MSPTCKITSTSLLAMMLAACSPSGPTPESNATPATEAGAPAATTVVTEAEAGTHPLSAADLQVARTAATDSCNIEAIGSEVFSGAPVEVADRVTTVGGWFLSGISKKSGMPARLLFLNANGDAGSQVRIDHWNARPDVTSAMAAADAGDVGFIQPVDLSALPAGQYQVSVAFEDGGMAYSCEKGRMIVLK